MNCKTTLVFLVFSVLSCAVNAQTGPSFDSKEIFTKINSNKTVVKGEMGRRMDITEQHNIQNLDLDSVFLEPFRQKKLTNGFIGTGMLLDAITKFASNSGNQRSLEIKDRIVDQLLKEQRADGYIGSFEKGSRMWNLWDIHEISYIIYGLGTNYKLFKDASSLTAAIRAADYIITEWDGKPAGWGEHQNVNLVLSVTGLDRAMLELYKLTNEDRFLRFIDEKKGTADWDLDIVDGRKPGIDGHIYSFMGMSLAQLELYRLRPEPRLLVQSEKAINFLLAEDGMMVAGQSGVAEAWNDNQEGGGMVGETCATAYSIRVYESLFRLFGTSIYGDVIERSLYNGLFAAQSPDGHKCRYYTPMVGERQYFNEQSYCCPNNYRRIVSEIPEMIYYQYAGLGGGIAVNLYTPSSTAVQLDNGATVRLEQRTSYPNNGEVKLEIASSKPTVFPLFLRIPSWCTAPSIQINGKPFDGKVAGGSMLKITREWTSNDEVVLEFPMELRLIKGRKRQSGRVVLMKGPIVFGVSAERNPQLVEANKPHGPATSPYDLGRVILDPQSVNSFSEDNSVRPGGQSFRISAWKEGYATERDPHNLTILFSEFADPSCVATYFRVFDMDQAVDDELLIENIAINKL